MSEEKGPPEIAVIGHPNEGKSSVLSTLAEDDSVRISPIPGETTVCRSFPVTIDGHEVLRFTDTPGFQNPERVLHELQQLAIHSGDPVPLLRQRFSTEAELRDDLELLAPVARGAAILYVVDGSRPLRQVDLAEMEILRLSGRPRMAVINCKDDDRQYLDSWKNAFRRTFNANRLFNAHRATYAERILLLEALQSIDQDWQPLLAQVVAAFQKDWASRLTVSCDTILAMLEEILAFRLTGSQQGHSTEQELRRRYCQQTAALEQQAHARLRALFKHRRFSMELPGQSILDADLFSETTWSLLGMSRQQLALIGALGGAALAAGLDLAAGGASLGLFTTLGGAAGALGAYLGGEQLLKDVKIMGIPLGEEQLQVGPNTNLNMLFVLLNRAFLYFQETVNWAHGRRDYPEAGTSASSAGFTQSWPAGHVRICRAYFTAITGDRPEALAESRPPMRDIIAATLRLISEGGQHKP